MQPEQKPPSTDVTVVTPLPLRLTPGAIALVKDNLKHCELLTHDVLEKDVDYGVIKGVPRDFLWDSGAQKIMAAFNCFPRYTILKSAEEEGGISITMECSLISRQSRQVVGTGVGACSTRETKYKYRWVVDPEEWGVPKKGLKQRQDGKYQVPNPELGDLVNTVVKIAAKRADVDAVQSLPGVAAALHKLFHGLPSTQPKPTSHKEVKESPVGSQATLGPGG